MDTTTIHGEHKHRWYRVTGLMSQFPPIAYTIPMDIVVAYGYPRRRHINAGPFDAIPCPGRVLVSGVNTDKTENENPVCQDMGY